MPCFFLCQRWGPRNGICKRNGPWPHGGLPKELVPARLGVPGSVQSFVPALGGFSTLLPRPSQLGKRTQHSLKAIATRHECFCMNASDGSIEVTDLGSVRLP